MAALTAAPQPAGADAGARAPVPPELEALEVALLLEALAQRFGDDFRGYEAAGLRRKLHGVMRRRGLRTVSALQDQALHDEGAGADLLRALSVAPAALFDDAAEAGALRAVLGACLGGAARPKVWLPECAGARQAWTLAILLAEQDLLVRTAIFATIANTQLLAEARDARCTVDELAAAEAAYRRGGGRGQLRDYFEIRDGAARPLPHLLARLTWAQYNLVTDASFNEFDLIVCRRALPDFGPLLRARVLRLFHASLAHCGVLALERPFDASDTLAASYRAVLPGQAWYKRIA
jgi:chemotaxis protein methyltransferase CheR